MCAAVAVLEDKVAGVHKNVISLIVKLIMTHPYGLMHGGLLGMQEWEERYRKVMMELQKMEKVLDDMLTSGANTGETDESDDEREESSSSAGSKKKKKRSQ